MLQQWRIKPDGALWEYAWIDVAELPKLTADVRGLDRTMTFRRVTTALLAALISLPSWAQQLAPGDVLIGTVTNIVDGDTADVALDSGPIRVRLHGIDTPSVDNRSFARLQTCCVSSFTERK